MRYINGILVTGKEKRGDWIKCWGNFYSLYIPPLFEGQKFSSKMLRLRGAFLLHNTVEIIHRPLEIFSAYSLLINISNHN